MANRDARRKRAHAMGRDAGKSASMSKRDNPYISGTMLHDDWNDGFDESRPETVS